MKLFKPAKSDLPEYDIPDVGQLISQVYGEVDPEKISMFVPVKNELPLLPQFLAHYRGMGFEQFLFYDDQSDDGTFDFLHAQPDCVVMHTTMTFGEMLHYTGKTHKGIRELRFGTFIKMAAPPHFLPGKIVAYFDADEFLLLPPGVTHIRQVYDRIEVIGSTGAYASVVEFFPRSVKSFAKPLPETVEGLFEEYGWFEPEALFDPMAKLDKKGKPVFTAPSKSMRLFEDFDIQFELERTTLREKVYLSSKEKRDQAFNRSARHKTPLLKRTDDSFMFSCHDAIVPPSGEILLTIAHFVFTSNFAQKITNVQKWKAHVKGGRKYKYYGKLMDTMGHVDEGFVGPNTLKYEGPEQLIECGLMKW
ncbi:MAG: glycosyltransferase family 2 protein [Marinovum sp.]|nr:glycosyltransferase family 2 protein [Marinovum sp.]